MRLPKERHSQLADTTRHDGDNRLPDGTLIVDRLAFKEACWQRLENAEKPLLNWVASRKFADDQHLRSYLWVSFQNLLQKMIYDLTPSLETRKKQFDRILTAICEKRRGKTFQLNEESKDVDPGISPSKTRILCLMKGSITEPSPPDRHTLREQTRRIQPPERRYSQKVESERGPSVNDQEMERFVREILYAVGGAVYYDDLLDLIVDAFHLKPIQLSSGEIVADEDGDSEIRVWDVMAQPSDEFPIAYEHREVAMKIWNDMTKENRRLFYESFVCEKKGQDIASSLKVSPSTISQRLKEMEHVFHLCFKDAGFTYEECHAVLSIIKDLAARECS